ncbi:MAG: GNAT family N-acetyltransferase [Euryarchaeota archaeon]|nr:GNAT family N-acetyltransferase [Euryarchaeota archaeon]
MMGFLWPLTRNEYFQRIVSCLDRLGVRLGIYGLYFLNNSGKVEIFPHKGNPSNGTIEVSRSPIDEEGVGVHQGNGITYVLNYCQEGDVQGTLHASFGPVYVPELEDYVNLRGMYLHRLSVNPRFRNRGIAKALIARARDIPAEEEYGRWMFCLVEFDNVPSKKAFEAIGFEMGCRLIFIKLFSLKRLYQLSEAHLVQTAVTGLGCE